MWMDAKGKFKSTKLLERGTNGKFVQGVQGYRVGVNSASGASKALLIGGAITLYASSAISIYTAGSYYYQGGANMSVGIKATLDVAMGFVGVLGPIGFAVSTTYFVADYATGGFGGYGDPNSN